MTFPAFANFFVPTSKAAAADFTVQPRNIEGTPLGSPISGGLTSTFAWRGNVPAGTATLDLVSESKGVIDTQAACRGAVGSDDEGGRGGRITQAD